MFIDKSRVREKMKLRTTEGSDNFIFSLT